MRARLRHFITGSGCYADCSAYHVRLIWRPFIGQGGVAGSSHRQEAPASAAPRWMDRVLDRIRRHGMAKASGWVLPSVSLSIGWLPQ